MENQDFHDIDNLIKRSLENLEVPYDEGSWDSLQEKMQDAQDNQLDETVRLAVGELVVPYEEGSWQHMRDRMSKAEADQVDQTARRALSNLIVPYNARSWGILLERLQQIEYRRRVIALKVLEAAVIVLALITVVRFAGIGNDAAKEQQQSNEFTSSKKFATNVTAPVAQDLISANSETESIDTKQKDKISSDVKGAIVEPDGVARTDLSAVAPRSATRVGDIYTTKSKFEASNQITRQNLASHPSDLTKANKNVDNRSSELLVTGNAELSEKTDHQDAMEGGKERASDAAGIVDRSSSHLAAIPALYFNVENAKHESIAVWEEEAPSAEELQLEALGVVKKSSKVKTRIGLYGQVNRHNTSAPHPFKRDVFFKEEKLDRPGIGFIANVQFGRLGFDFGFAHDKVAFEAPLWKAKSEVQRVQLPLHLRYNVFQKKDFAAYVKGGIVANGIILADYADLAATASVAPGVQTETDPSPDKYNDGLLKGGIADNNLYWQTSVAVGVEGRLKGNFSVFAEGLMQNHLDGTIGHNRTQFSSRSLQVGILYQID